MSTVWMSTDGDDANPGTKEQPLATFAAAYAALPPEGGIVRLHAGHYILRDPEMPPRGVSLIGEHRPTPWWRRLLRRARHATILHRKP